MNTIFSIKLNYRANSKNSSFYKSDALKTVNKKGLYGHLYSIKSLS
jgi:hypothetical protein